MFKVSAFIPKYRHTERLLFFDGDFIR